MKLIFIILSLVIWEYGIMQVDKYVSARNNMVKTQITDRGISNTAVIKAMKKVPRHLFIPKEYENDAYGDFPVPIGHGQTISQPYM